MSATRQFDQTVTHGGRLEDRSGRRIVREAGIAHGVGESQQVVGARLRLSLDCESDHFPTAWRRKVLRMRLTEVVAVRFHLAGQRAEDRGGISVSVGERRGARIRASSSRTSP